MYVINDDRLFVVFDKSLYSSYIYIINIGISLPGSRNQRPNKIESPNERYVRLLKGVPERYSILQVGVALFSKNPNYKKKSKVNGKKSHHYGENDSDEHAYMHREGMLNEDELINTTEQEEEEQESGSDNNGDDEEAEYTSRIYNFYLFPNGKTGSDREITMNPSTIKFLLDNHMDFDKVFREGVSYTTVEQANYLKKKYYEKYNDSDKKKSDESTANGYTPRKGGKVKLTRVEDIAFVARAMAELREWIDTGNVDSDNDDEEDTEATATAILNGAKIVKEEGSSLVLPPCNAFLRRCLYETIEDEYPGLILERADAAPNANGTSSPATRNQIRAIRLSSVEKKRREKRLQQEAWDRVLMDIGFTTIFKAISDVCNGKLFTKEQTSGFLDGLYPSPSTAPAEGETGKRVPLIIHNGLMDLMFLLTHCHQPTLPDHFEDTKKIIGMYFPLVYDTKVLATEYSDAIIQGSKTSLEDLYGLTCTEGAFITARMKVPSIANHDGRSQGQAHEAAYDAYMTGSVFNALVNRILESKNRHDHNLSLDGLLYDSTSNDDILKELVGLNRIYMHVSLYTIDLESSSGPVVGLHDPLSKGLSIDTTFHVCGITTSVSTRDIFQALSSGNESEEEVIRTLKYEIIWIDDESFFVGTRMVDDASSNSVITRGVVASVKNKLHDGLGNVKIVPLGQYFQKKYSSAIERSDSVSFTAGLVSVATKPFQVLGSVLAGFSKKRSSISDNGEGGGGGGAKKRARLG